MHRLSRLLVAALSAGLAVSVLPAALGSDAEAAPGRAVAPVLAPARASGAGADITYFTLNVKHNLDKAKAASDMRKALTLGQVGGFQEMSQAVDRASLRKLCAQRGWGVYMPRSGGIATPIVWNERRFSLVFGTTTKIYGFQKGVTPARFIDTVRLRDRQTGRTFGVINTHTISRASRDAEASDPTKVPRLRLHIKMLHDKISTMFRRTENVVAGGDLNINYLADRRRQVAGFPTEELGKMVDFDMPLAGSHGPTSLFDYVMTLKNGSGLALVGSRIVHGFNSDHDAVVATFRPLNLFATGPVFNNPHGDPGARRRVVSRLSRAVEDTERGSVVRVAMSRITDPQFTAALIAAHRRGVDVRLILDGGRITPAERELVGELGTDTDARSWAHRCSAGCRSAKGGQHAQFLVVSRTEATSDLVISSSAPAVARATRLWSDAYVVASADVYRAYRHQFAQMMNGTTGPDYVKRVGAFRTQPYPVPISAHRVDPVLHLLAPVRCKAARTVSGRTAIRITMGSWSGSRGAAIARELVDLRHSGCDIRVVAGPSVSTSIRAALARGGIAVHSARTGQSVMALHGHFGRRHNRTLVWAGSIGFTDAARNDDGSTLEVPTLSTLSAYFAQFRRASRQG